MREIIQNRFFVKRQAKIFDNKVIYKSGSFGKESEVNIPFEELLRYKESHILISTVFEIIVAILGFITIICFAYRNDKDFEANAWVFWGILFLISILGFLVNRENLWKVKVSNNTYLFFFKKTPNESSVEKFIEELFITRDQYLKETYFTTANKNIPYETQMNNYNWLYRVEAINKIEFELRKKELDNIFKMETNKIGFN
jgi:hypothetical protein